MPRYALLDSDGVVTNVVAAESARDLTHATQIRVSKRDPNKAAVAVETEVYHHLEGHGAVRAVETAPGVKAGWLFDGSAFSPPPPEPTVES